jgi:hypothetical protein
MNEALSVPLLADYQPQLETETDVKLSISVASQLMPPSCGSIT